MHPDRAREPGGAGLDAAGLVAALLALPPDDVAGLLDLAARCLPHPATLDLLMADYPETTLTRVGPHPPAAAEGDQRLVTVEGTPAGRAYRCQEPTVDERGAAWLPVTHRGRRLGVLELRADGLPPGLVTAGLTLAELLASVVESAARRTDAFHTARRRSRMTLTAEMQWELLPPPTVVADGLVVTGKLEPAYDVGGDAFDHAVTGRTAHVAVFDPVGHDLRSTLLATLAVGVLRHGRRSGASLAEIGTRIDAAVIDQFAASYFVTGVLCEIDLDLGDVTWLNAGHPPPLLLRDGTVTEVRLARNLPWGLHPRSELLSRTTLEPGDRLLLFTDGVTDARSPDGEAFGRERLAALLTAHLPSALPGAELLRLLVQEVGAHRSGPLADDATAVLVEWRTGDVAPA